MAILLESKLFANNVKYNKIGSLISCFNQFGIKYLFNKIYYGNFITQRSVPKLTSKTLNAWYKNKPILAVKKLYIFSVMNLPISMIQKLEKIRLFY